MKMNAAKKRTGAGLILMILGAVLILAGAWMALNARTGIFEYVLAAPAGDQIPSQLEDLSKVLTDDEWSAAVRTQNVSAGRDTNGTTVTLYAVSEGYFDLHHETFAEGRPLSGEDIRSRRKAAVINRAAASALFQGLDPVGQTFSCGGNDLEVVGVTKDGYRIGETSDAVVWIPVTLTGTEGSASSTLEIRAFAGSPVHSVILKNLLTQWSAGGTSWDYNRQRLSAFMPLWLLGAVAGYLLLRALVSGAAGKGRQMIGSFRELLKDRYIGQLKGRIAGAILLAAAAAALLIAGIWLWLRYLMIPLYTFTDWIPEALVDPNAIAATVKSLLTGAASSSLYRSADAAAFGMYAAWIAAGTLLFTVGLGVRLFALRRKHKDNSEFRIQNSE